MRLSELKAGGHYAMEYGRHGEIVECYVLEPKGWKANRQSSRYYRGEQRPIRSAGAGGTAVLMKRYSNWVPVVVNCSKITRTWEEHTAAVREANERARRQRVARETAERRRNELTPYVNAAATNLNMRFSVGGYNGTVTIAFDDLITLLGGEALLRQAHGETVAALLEQQAAERRQREEAERIRQLQVQQEREEREARRRAELEAERTAAPMASELVSGEVQ